MSDMTSTFILTAINLSRNVLPNGSAATGVFYAMTQTLDTPVLVAGAGPTGLVLASVLSGYGINCVLVERNTHTTRFPKMDVTNGASMELLRRLGVHAELRRVGAVADPAGGARRDPAGSAMATMLASDLRSGDDGTLSPRPVDRRSAGVAAADMRSKWRRRASHHRGRHG